MKKFKRAFTIVELVIVIAVVAILAAVLIPTISGVVDRANLSTDEQVAANLTKQIKISMATTEINDESDIWNILEETYGENYAEALVAKSKGNNFWYDIEKKEVFVGNEETLNQRATSNLSRTKFSRIDNSSFDTASLRIFGSGKFLLLDQGNNGIGKVLKELENATDMTFNSIVESIEGKQGLEGELYDNLVDNGIAIANQFGILSKVDQVKNIYIPNNISFIGNGKNIDNITFEDVEKINLPSGVKVDSFSLELNISVNLYVNTTESELENIFSASSTDCTIVLPDGSKYCVEETKIYKLLEEDEKKLVANLDYSSTIDNFKISESPKSSMLQYISNDEGNDVLWIAFDNNLEFELMAYDFRAGSNPMPSNGVTWEVIKGSEYIQCLDDSNGKFKVLKVHPVGNEDYIEIKVTEKMGAVSKTIKVRMARITDVFVNTIEGASKEGNQFTFSYDGDNAKTWNINTVLTQTPSYSVTDNLLVKCDPDKLAISFEGENNAFTLVDNKLGIKEGATYGTATLKVQYGELFNVYPLELVDNTESPFAITDSANTEEKFGHTLVVGKSNVIMLGSLFETSEQINVNDVRLSFYQINGDVPTQITNITYTAGTTWEVGTLDFSKIANNSKIKIDINSGNSKPFSILVTIVNGYNIFNVEDLISYKDSGNLVLLNSFELESKFDTYRITNLKTMYGNYNTINASLYKNTSSNGSTNGFIQAANGVSINELVLIGPVYPSIVSSTGGKDGYFNHGICMTGGTIVNSYISHFRAPLRINSGSVALKNSVVEGGCYANVYVYNASKIEFDNSYTVQNRDGYISTVGGTKTVLGAGIHLDTKQSSAITVTMTNGSYQYNWINQNDSYDSAGDAISEIFATSGGCNGSELTYDYEDALHKVGDVYWTNCGITHELDGTEYAHVVPTEYKNINISKLGKTIKFYTYNASPADFTIPYELANGNIGFIESRKIS